MYNYCQPAMEGLNRLWSHGWLPVDFIVRRWVQRFLNGMSWALGVLTNAQRQNFCQALHFVRSRIVKEGCDSRAATTLEGLAFLRRSARLDLRSPSICRKSSPGTPTRILRCL